MGESATITVATLAMAYEREPQSQQELNFSPRIWLYQTFYTDSINFNKVLLCPLTDINAMPPIVLNSANNRSRPLVFSTAAVYD